MLDDPAALVRNIRVNLSATGLRAVLVVVVIGIVIVSIWAPPESRRTALSILGGLAAATIGLSAAIASANAPGPRGPFRKRNSTIGRT